MSPARRRDLLMGAVAALIIIVDQITKHWVVSFFVAPGARAPITLVAHLLDLEYIQNTGAAFSLLAGQAQLFVFIAVAVGVIGYLYWRTRESTSLLLKLAFGLVLGGAFGNLIDRFTHAYVVDFIYFHIGTRFEWPIFNVADSAISVGVVLLALLLWRGTADIAPRDAPITIAHAGVPETPHDVTTESEPAPSAPLAAPHAREVTPGE